MIVDSGYPLNSEMWLDNDFQDILLGPEGPVEFRDVAWDKVPGELIDAARTLFKSLKRQRRCPSTLKTLTRLAIRRSVMRSPCLRCKLDAWENPANPSLEDLMGSLNLPSKLRDFVAYLDF